MTLARQIEAETMGGEHRQTIEQQAEFSLAVRVVRLAFRQGTTSKLEIRNPMINAF